MKKGKLSIAILHRGWVVVGKLTPGPWVKIEEGYVVRRWGTSKGLGELASSGPTSSTILDAAPTMNVPPSAIINTIECDEKAWKKWAK